MNCECCSLREDCTQAYITTVKENFDGKWLCGLCSEAVRYEAGRGRRSKGFKVEDALGAHMSLCRNFRLNPAVHVADGMKQMLRRRSDVAAAVDGSAAMRFGRSVSALR